MSTDTKTYGELERKKIARLFGNSPTIDRLNNSKAARQKAYPRDIAFLPAFGVGYPELDKAVVRAVREGCSASKAMISSGIISETKYYQCVAQYLGVPFSANHMDPNAIDLGSTDAQTLIEQARLLIVREAGAPTRLMIAPDAAQLDEIRLALSANQMLRSQVMVTTPTRVRSTLIQTISASNLKSAVWGLFQKDAELSASRVFLPTQMVMIFVAIALCIAAFFYAPMITALLLHILATIFYLSCVLVRLVAAISMQPSERQPKLPPTPVPDNQLPVYTVLIALYREAGQVPRLVRSLSALDWPKSKLEIKLICEADDPETIQAVENHIDGQPFELITVPPANPRTKPKALNYALPFCKGRYLVLYDAEDIPHPQQLREAHHAFHCGPRNLACLQAPLIIHNHKENWITRLFTIEYSALFDGLLPVLAKWRAPLPLGGTSNHFERAILEQIGAWDPHNVTEDADLGMRLARFGYSTATITLPTLEEAPAKANIWIPQRTRWLKGWMQTWLVHMRRPIALTRDLGIKNTVLFHTLITGMILSSLMHPLFLVSLAFTITKLISTGGASVFYLSLFGIDLINILLGYLAFGVLAFKTLPLRNLQHLRKSMGGIPAYWMLVSFAGWRALLHLLIKPFLWEKTPHADTAADEIQAE